MAFSRSTNPVKAQMQKRKIIEAQNAKKPTALARGEKLAANPGVMPARNKKENSAQVREFLALCDKLAPVPELHLPSELAVCADLAYQIRETRRRLNNKVDELKKLETQLCDHLIAAMPKSQGGVKGKVAWAEISVKPIPRVEDWDKFYAHIIKTKSFDLLQRRPNDGAIKERWENKKQVPGVGTFEAVTVSLTKA